MQEQLISFETAKLAKEKRFDCKCLAGYKSNGELRECYIDDLEDIFNSIYPISNSDIKDAVNKEWIFYDGCICPTQSLLQKWLREKHNIFITIEIDATSYPKFTYSILKYTELLWETGLELGVNNLSLYRTYEEALEEGLQEALKLIK